MKTRDDLEAFLDAAKIAREEAQSTGDQKQAAAWLEEIHELEHDIFLLGKAA